MKVVVLLSSHLNLAMADGTVIDLSPTGACLKAVCHGNHINGTIHWVPHTSREPVDHGIGHHFLSICHCHSTKSRYVQEEGNTDACLADDIIDLRYMQFCPMIRVSIGRHGCFCVQMLLIRRCNLLLHRFDPHTSAQIPTLHSRSPGMATYQNFSF
jgi:hypothetical protein